MCRSGLRACWREHQCEDYENTTRRQAAGVPAAVKKALDGSSNSWVGTTAKHYQERAVAYRARLKAVDAS